MKPNANAVEPAAPIAAWADVAIASAQGPAARLAPEQPEHGLLWVTRGTITVSRAGRAHEIRKGTVVAYRLSPDLTWAAASGAQVRWSRREVSVGPGQVAPWTTDLALDGPASARPARRGLYASLTVALSWIVAITVAWCYDRAHAERAHEVSRLSREAGNAAADRERDLGEDVQGVLLLETGYASELAFPPFSGWVHLVVALPEAEESTFLEGLHAFSAHAYEQFPGLRRLWISAGPLARNVSECPLRLSADASGSVTWRGDTMSRPGSPASRAIAGAAPR